MTPSCGCYLTNKSATVKILFKCNSFASDPADKEAMDEAERHALQVIPEGASLLTFFVYALIPESIRFALNLTVYAR